MSRPAIGAARAARIVSLALAAGAMLLSIQAFRTPAHESRIPAPVNVAPEITPCDLRHPIDARLVALDPVARRGLVRVALDIESSVPLSSAAARVVSTGGATLVGKQRTELGTLEAGDARRTEFTLRLPATGRRFVLQVLTTAETATGPMNRLAMLNILPDGPADAGRVVTTPAGETIREYTASARRIER